MEPTNNLKQAIKDYKNGNSQAFDVLYNESSKYVYTCIYKVMCGNDNTQDAINDIMQDTYVEISRYITQLEDEERFLSWAGTIATRKCYAYLKKSRKYVLLNEEDTTLDTLADNDNIIPESIIQDKEKQRLIREIIEKELSEMQKLCIIAFYYNGQKQSEIAQELGIPENTVKTNLSRAKAKIEKGIYAVEKRDGIRLHSVAPFLLLLFTEEVQAAEVPQEITKNVLESISGLTATTSSAATAGVKGAAGKAVTTSIKAKVIGGVVGLGVLGAIGVGAYLMNQQPEEVNNNEVPYSQEVEAPQIDDSMDDVIEEVESESEEVSDELPFEEGTWQLAYYNCLMGDLSRGDKEGFDLHDFDGDGVPELLIGSEDEVEYKCFADGKTQNIELENNLVSMNGIGYGEKASQIIYFWESTMEDGIDDSMYILYDNFEFIEKVQMRSIISEGNYPYNIETHEGSTEVSYEEGQAKIQSIRETYKKADFKEMNAETIIATLKAYR